MVEFKFSMLFFLKDDGSGKYINFDKDTYRACSAYDLGEVIIKGPEEKVKKMYENAKKHTEKLGAKII